MIEIAESFAQDLYQEGDLYAERDNKIQLPRVNRPAGIGETGAVKRRAGVVRGTAGHPLHAQQRRR